MSITLGSNIAALQAQRQLFGTNQKLATVFERLSSGQRINRASDDAAGLAIAETLRTDQRVYSQGIRNLNDGLSLLNIADSTVAELSGIVIRIQELAEQAANGSVSNQQRQSLDLEAQELSEEFFRVSREANFNDLRLFDGSIENGVRLQGGYGDDGSIFSSLGGKLGDSTFSKTFSLGLGSGNRTTIAEDFNGDGDIDLLVTNPLDDTVVIALGNGDGTFGNTSTLSINLPSSVQVDDINGDGILDLVSTNNSDDEVSISLGIGDGTFRSPSTISDLSNPSSVVLGDVNNDGIKDVVLGNRFNTDISVLLGNGDGTFQDAQTALLNSGASEQIQLADFNGDGVLDMAVANVSAPAQEILIGNGDGTFQTSQVIGTSATGYLMEVADINGDGVLDLVYEDYNNDNVQSKLGNGDGTFQSEQLLYSSNDPIFSLTFGDTNGDGAIDLVVGIDDSFSIVLSGQGDGTFNETSTFNIGQSNENRAVLEDFNGDGVLDFAALEGSGPSIALGGTREGLAPILEFSLGTQADALQALAPLERKLNSLSEQRGIIGAFQSRIQSAIATLGATDENYAAAESRIRDADIAFESSQLTRLTILQQAASAVLGQANVQPALALQLLS